MDVVSSKLFMALGMSPPALDETGLAAFQCLMARRALRDT